jgi:hypothetical protein
VKKRGCILLAALMALAALSGCRQTPEKPLVIGKNTEKMLKMAMVSQDTQGSLAETLGVTSGRYETYLEDKSGNIRVTVDADVVLPAAGGIPIIRVAAKPFSQDTADNLIDLLFEDGALYTPESLSELTKTDIVKLLTQFKQKKAELEAQGMLSEQSDSSAGEVNISKNNGSENNEDISINLNQLDQLNNTIELYEQKLKTAPDDKTYTEVSGTLETQDISGMSEEKQKEYQGKLFETAHVGQLNRDGGMRSLFVINNEKSNSYRIQYINRKDYDSTTGMYYAEEQWKQSVHDAGQSEADAMAYPSMKEDEAKELADQFLTQIGIDYMDCTDVEKVIGGSSSEYAGGIRTGNLLKAYRLQYVRKVSGVPVTYTSVESSWDDTDSGNVWIWDYERMTLIIDDGGIVEMIWSGPYELTGSVTDTAKMLTFPEIRDIFEKMIIVNTANYSEYGMDLNVIEARLGLARITEQNNLKSGLLIPVWDFFGTAAYHYGDGESELYTESASGKSYLTINAIDGSIVNRSAGY